MDASELQAGTCIDNRYVLKEFKGRGAFGEVWLAEDKVLGIDLAIKVYVMLDERGQEEFKEEYKISSNLLHQNLLTPKYYSVWSNRPFLIMKYCPNGSVADMCGNASEKDIWHFIHDVACGLMYLHAQNPPIIHQDIKPENILVDETGAFLITDFGISKKMRSTMRKQSKRNAGSGTIAYMGPEHFTAQPLTVMASDIWSLGVSIYELATGELPFVGQGGAMLNVGAEIPGLDASQYSTNLSDVMRRCLAKDTWDRPTAEQLAKYSDYVLTGGNEPFESWANGGNARPDKKEPAYTGKTIDLKAQKKNKLLVAAALILGIICGCYAYFANRYSHSIDYNYNYVIDSVAVEEVVPVEEEVVPVDVYVAADSCAAM